MMKNEFAANQALQTKHQGQAPIAYKQGKHATIGAMMQNYFAKFVALSAVAITIKHFI